MLPANTVVLGLGLSRLMNSFWLLGIIVYFLVFSLQFSAHGGIEMFFLHALHAKLVDGFLLTISFKNCAFCDCQIYFLTLADSKDLFSC